VDAEEPDAGQDTDAGAEPDATVFAPRPPPTDLCAAFDAVAPIEMEAVGGEWHGAVEVALVPGRFQVYRPQLVDYDGLARSSRPRPATTTSRSRALDRIRNRG
jgi:hypothetical protein